MSNDLGAVNGDGAGAGAGAGVGAGVGAGAGAVPGRAPGGAPRPSGQRQRRHPLRGLGRGLDAAARRDSLLVAFMVIAMTLSAFAVYQATQAGDAADQRLGELRLAEGDAARQNGYLQTIVAHDLDVMTKYCEAEISRSDALTDVLDGTVDVAAIASHTIMTRSLRPLVLGDRLADCRPEGAGGASAHYDIDRARQSIESSQELRRNPVTAPGRQDAVLAARGAAEQFLMTAGMLFALVLALLIAVDLLGRSDERPDRWKARTVTRWRRGLIVVAAIAGLAGAILLVTFSLFLPADDTARLVALGFAVFLAVTIVLIARTATRARRPIDRRRPHWWSSVIGAGALVVFAVAAVGLAAVSAAEREANMRADALQGSAQQLQQLGEQAAVRDLAAVATSAGFAAETAAAATLRLTDPEQSASDLSELALLESRLAEQLREFDDAVRAQSRSGLAPACEPQRVASARGAEDERPDPSSLYSELANEIDNVLWHVRQFQQPSVECDIESAIMRAEAQTWGRHGSLFTVALVILGLAGFMLSLASDSQRDPRLSRILRGVGVIGLGVGLAVCAFSLPDIVGRSGLPDPDDVHDLAAAVASARIDACGAEAVSDLDEAIALYAGFGPAFEARGRAILCHGSMNDWWRYTSDADPVSVAAAVSDFATARRLGASGPTIDQDEGWLRMLDGIQRDDEAAIAAGLALTDSAIAQIESASDAGGPPAPGTSLHIARFNSALAHAALGDEEAALAAYEKAERCLAPVSECPGGGILDDALIDDVVLWALADLELLGKADPRGDSAWDAYRLVLVDAPAPDEPGGDSLGDLTLDMYPQDAYAGADDPPAQATIVWYSRSATDDTWSLLQVPSHTTMHPGGYLLARPVALGECAPAAYYRADVYAGGERRSVSLGRRYAPPEDGIRVTSMRLALSAIVPSWWSAEPDQNDVYRCDWNDEDLDTSIRAVESDDGLDWHVGPTDAAGLTVRRIEGVVPGADVDAYLLGELTAWAAESRGVGAAELAPREDGYFLGSSRALVADTPDRRARFAVAYEPYAWEASSLGGTLFLAALDGFADESSTLRVDPSWMQEIVLEIPQQRFPVRLVEGDGFALEISGAWQVAPRSGDGAESADEIVLAARTPDTYPTLEVRVWEDDTREIREVLDEWEDSLSTGESRWEDVTLGPREPVEVAGAEEAVRFEFTGTWDGTRYAVSEVYASDGATITYVRIVDWEESQWKMRPTIEATLESLRLQ